MIELVEGDLAQFFSGAHLFRPACVPSCSCARASSSARARGRANTICLDTADSNGDLRICARGHIASQSLHRKGR